MKFKIILLALAVLAGAGWWIWQVRPEIADTIQQYVDNGDFLTLEARYTPQQIMEKHRKELLVDANHTFQDPELKFYPYLLMEVKYIQSDKKTREGKLLWCLTSGEMVIDADSWEMSHGFKDAIHAGASRSDFKIMQALAKQGGGLTRDQLQDELRLEAEGIAPWIKHASDQHLIVQTDGKFQLHFENPNILVQPETRIKQRLVTKAAYQSNRIARKYSQSQIERISQAAFGTSFTIREAKELFLPVYWISVLNPDGTVLTTYWNAVSGERLDS